MPERPDLEERISRIENFNIDNPNILNEAKQIKEKSYVNGIKKNFGIRK